MKRGLIALLMVMALILVPSGVVSAAPSQEVTITAKGSFISISNSPASYDFGTVAASTNYSTIAGCFTVTNGSSVLIDVTIGTNNTNWVSDGGANWTHDDTGTPDADTAALYSSPNNEAWNIIVKNATPNNIVSSQDAETNFQWELRLMSPTSFTDGKAKAIKVVLTASPSS